ncbi:MAG: hypothetical protein ACYCYM_11955 [Saccharofermentanales bacterium]
MSECKARHISLTMIAAEAILLFLFYCLVVLNTNLSQLSVQGAKPPIDMLISLLIFLCIGIFIVLGVFYKTPYHLLAILEITLTAMLMLSGSGFHILLIVFYMVVLAPLIFYYAIRIWNR